MAEGIEFDERMGDADALMWGIEKDPMLRSTIVSVVLLDRAPDRARFADTIERASRSIPRLRQRVVSNPLSIAPPRWEVDPNFDLSYHMRWTRASRGGTLRDLFDFTEPVAMHSFDRARPLWEFTVVEGLAQGRAALIEKVHHSLTDGLGGMELQMALLDTERDPADRGELPEEPVAQPMSQPQRMRDALAYETRRQLAAGRRAVGTAGDTVLGAISDPRAAAIRTAEVAGSIARWLRPATEPLSPVMTRRSLSVHFDSFTVPFGETKATAKRLGYTLNDAFLAAVSGGFARYHDVHDRVPEALRMGMPISTRTEATRDRAGNQFSPARFPVPLTIDDPAERMRAIHELVQGQRAEPALALTEPLAGILNRLPRTATTSLFGALLKGVDIICSNVPGAPFEVFVAGARMESQIAFGPMTGAASNITLVSYLDDLSIGVNTDPAAVPDPDVLTECLRAGFDEVLKA